MEISLLSKSPGGQFLRCCAVLQSPQEQSEVYDDVIAKARLYAAPLLRKGNRLLAHGVEQHRRAHVNGKLDVSLAQRS